MKAIKRIVSLLSAKMIQTTFGCISPFGMHRLPGRIGTFGYTGIADIIYPARVMRNRVADLGTRIGPASPASPPLLAPA
jgi:hypothetical protein